MSTTEKTKLYNRLNETHDMLYAAIEIAEDLPANTRTSELLDMMDRVNARMESIMENGFWKKEAD